VLKDAIKKYGIYENKDLRDYIIGLENRYKIKDEVKFFNQLVNFSKNKNIPYHGWFKYREGFSHTLIKELINRSQISKEEYILDPFCGSGTTIVEAAMNGFSGIGIDINPMSSFISKVKCRSYSDEELAYLSMWSEKINKELLNCNLPVEYKAKYKEVEKFFNSNNFENLLNIRFVIDGVKENIGEKLYEFFLCAYICIIETVSDRKRDGNGLKTQATKIEDVYKHYGHQIQLMLSDIKQYRINDEVKARVEFGSALELSKVLETSTEEIGMPIGVIMYSPPYANSFDYFESYKMEVILADYAKDMKEINIFRQQAVESFVGKCDIRKDTRDFIKWMADEIEDAIPVKEAETGKRDGRTRKVPKMIKGYFADMEKVIEQSAIVLSKNKYCYIVVDQSAYLGRIIPTDLFLASIGESYGFDIEEIIVCRNAKTSGQQLQKYPYLKDSLRESITVMKRKE
jgi:site-specific DNA-methyltransferase (adenine-specific)